MNNLEELTLKVEQIIKFEKENNPDIQYLTPAHAKLIAQIISNYKLNSNNEVRPHAKMIFLGAPTGAGKDTLVRKIMLDYPEKNFVVLNMDMFRHYHNEISGVDEHISDKDFAKKTNQTSYELYYIIEQTILKEFPGTDVIVTGTMKDLDWVKEIVERYKNDPNTNYDISLSTLAVPIKESAFSIFERYLNMIDTRDSSNTPLRYTDLEYHNATIKDFTSNVRYFENDLHNNPNNSFFDSIKVYRRNKDMYDLSEDTLIYDSNNQSSEKCATTCIHEIMNTNLPIDPSRIASLLDIIKRNSDYLKSQNLYKDILTDLEKILPQLNRDNNDFSK